MIETIKRESGIMECKKCGAEMELFGVLENGNFKYCCKNCFEIFFSNILYVK